jgi:hypothetical protein
MWNPDRGRKQVANANPKRDEKQALTCNRVLNRFDEAV